MKIFITGATGFVGSVVAEQAIAEGHTVYGLSRNEKGDEKLKAIGAHVVRGDLSSLDVLKEQSSKADAVLHLAFIHDWTMDYNEVLRIDAEAVSAMGEALKGTEKPLVITSGTGFIEPNGKETNEDSPISTTFPMAHRIKSERHALALSSKGVRVSAIRLPPYVYGRGGGIGFVVMLMETAFKIGESLYAGEGTTLTTGVHVEDAAALYLLAAKKAEAGQVFNATASEHVSLKEMAEAVGAVLKVPVRSTTKEEVAAKWGPFLTGFVHNENLPSNRKAMEKLGWKPKGIDLLTDIRTGSYVEIAAKLRKG